MGGECSKVIDCRKAEDESEELMFTAFLPRNEPMKSNLLNNIIYKLSQKEFSSEKKVEFACSSPFLYAQVKLSGDSSGRESQRRKSGITAKNDWKGLEIEDMFKMIPDEPKELIYTFLIDEFQVSVKPVSQWFYYDTSIVLQNMAKNIRDKFNQSYSQVLSFEDAYFNFSKYKISAMEPPMTRVDLYIHAGVTQEKYIGK